MLSPNDGLLSELELEAGLKPFLRLLVTLITDEEMSEAVRTGLNFRNDVFTLRQDTREATCDCGAKDDPTPKTIISHDLSCSCVQPNFQWLNGDNFMVTWNGPVGHLMTFPRISRAEFKRLVKECLTSINP